MATMNATSKPAPRSSQAAQLARTTQEEAPMTHIHRITPAIAIAVLALLLVAAAAVAALVGVVDPTIAGITFNVID
jgi:hypothetical protein